MTKQQAKQETFRRVEKVLQERKQSVKGSAGDLKRAQDRIHRKSRNQLRRAQNQILVEICGTSAAAARRDMGL